MSWFMTAEHDDMLLIYLWYQSRRPWFPGWLGDLRYLARKITSLFPSSPNLFSAHLGHLPLAFQATVKGFYWTHHWVICNTYHPCFCKKKNLKRRKKTDVLRINSYLTTDLCYLILQLKNKATIIPYANISTHVLSWLFSTPSHIISTNPLCLPLSFPLITPNTCYTFPLRRRTRCRCLEKSVCLRST